MRQAAITAARVPGPWVPGWFPLVAERVHRRVGPVCGECDADVLGVRLRLTLEEYTQRRYFYHCYEAPELRFIRRVLRPGDEMVDVGAHVGLVSLVAARAVGHAGRVHAVEPVPENAERLALNARLNGFHTIAIHRVAAGSAAGTASLGLPEVGVLSGSSGAYALGAAHAALEVPVVPLDELLPAPRDRERYRVVKLDAEGHEPQILRGMEGILASRPPDFITIEINADALERAGRGHGEAVELLRRHGYRLGRLSVAGRVRELDGSLGWERLGALLGRLGLDDGPLRQGLAERGRFFSVVAARPGAAR